MRILCFTNKNNILSIYLILFSTITLLFNCKQELKNSKNPNVLKDSIVSKPVVIFGKSTDDKNAFDNINIFSYSDFFAGRNEELSNLNLNDSESLTLDSINKPQIIELMTFGDKPYRTRMFVSPGDIINVNIKNNKLKFTGTNESHYNFYLELDSLDNQWSKNEYKGDINDYKKNSIELQQKRLNFFNQYIKEHEEVSEEFINQVKSELNFEYLYNLVAPRSIVTEGSNSYVNNLEGVMSTLENESNLVDGNILNLEDYFDNIAIEDFNRPELINNDYFKRSLVQYIRHYFTKQEYISYTKENFEQELNFINKNLNGEIAKYATGRLIHDFYEKGFGQDEYNLDQMKDLISNYNKQILNSSYRKAITEIEEDLNLFNAKITNELLNEKLLTLNNDTITLKEVFNNTKGKLKVINFWASWCSPCISDFKNSQQIKNDMANNNNFDWIYISIEKNTVNWMDNSQKLKDYLSTEHQYKILDNMNSGMLEFLKVRKNNTIEVPRYILLDSENKILLNNVPRPSDSLTFSETLQKVMYDRY